MIFLRGWLCLAATVFSVIECDFIVEELNDTNFRTLLNLNTDEVLQPFSPSMQYAVDGSVALLVMGDGAASVRCRAAQVSFATVVNKFRERAATPSSIFSDNGTANEAVMFAKAYQETSPNLFSILDIAKVPALFLFFSTGGYSVFDGVMSQSEEIVSWMDRLVHRPLDEIKSLEELVALTEEPEDNVAVAFFADSATGATTYAQTSCAADVVPNQSVCSSSSSSDDMLRTGRAAMKDFASVSRVLWRNLSLRFAVVESSLVAAELGIELNGIVPRLMLFKERGAKPISLPNMTVDKDTVTRAIRRNLLPPILRLSEDNLTQIFSSDFDFAVLFQRNIGSHQIDLEDTFADVIRNIDRTVYGNTVFLISSTDSPVERRLLAELDQEAARSVTHVVTELDAAELDPTSKLYFFRLNQGVVTEKYCFNSDLLATLSASNPEQQRTQLTELSNEINEFLVGASSRWIPVYKKSQPAPDVQTAPVYQLVASTFEKLVYNPKITVFVFYHAPWCGHSLNADLPFKEAAMAFSSDQSILFAKIDGTRNDVPDNFVYSYPQFVMYPRSNKASPVVYDGELSSDAFMTFAAIFSDLP
eukprot:Lankesteria_metandrocarpae@DN6041_c0_g1_i1.p1